MALLHRDRTDTRTDHDVADDTVAGAGTAARPGWGRHGRDDERPVVVRQGSVGSTIRTVIATVLLVAVVAVAVANTGTVDVDLLFESYDVSLSLLVGAAAAAGLLIGMLVGARRRPRTG